MSTRSLDGAVVAVIGASGGLGAPLARSLSKRGARLLVGARDPERLASLGIPNAEVLSLDLREAEAGDALVRTAQERHGRLDGLINVAGVVAFGPLTETSDEVIHELFLANVLGPLWMMRRTLPLLDASSGFVLNVSAVVAEQPMANMTAYSAAKAAISAADEALTKELRRSGVTVCDARPPHTNTGLDQRPIAGTAPKLPMGLDPDLVAARLVLAIEQGETDVPSTEFAKAD